ncbi:MAG TPA: SDR family oxidoreductase [Thermoleophilaceae bacterium]
MIAVCGATGELGGRVAALLAERGAQMRLIVRDPARAPMLDGAEVAVAAGYHDTDEMTDALRGADAVFLVSGRESPNRLDEHKSAVDAIVRAGVERVVYTSFANATPDTAFKLGRQHHATEEYIRETGVSYTFLRDNPYLDFVPFYTRPEGVITAPGGDGRIAFVARDDVADVAAAVLSEPGHDGQAYLLTGGSAMTLAEAAALLGRSIGREIVYEPETIEEAYASRADYGAPDWEVEGWVTSYVAMARGEYEEVTDCVERLAGHPPRELPELLERYPAIWAHLR